MKIKKGFVVREIAGQSVVVALGSATKDFNGMIKLNDSGRVIWDMLSEGKAAEDIVKKLMEIYEIDEETVRRDVEKFINTLQGANILE
ncbi:MAG: PqqD family protein [Ruminococcaceae bacterium]|nr:PqqD family protein [Oscillospiraceae bacterium]